MREPVPAPSFPLKAGPSWLGGAAATGGSKISTVPPAPEVRWKLDVVYLPEKLMLATTEPPLETVSTPELEVFEV
jgi:hypothetical protein